MKLPKKISKKQLFLITCVAQVITEHEPTCNFDECRRIEDVIDVAALSFFTGQGYTPNQVDKLADKAVEEICAIWEKYEEWPEKWRY